MYGFEDFGEGRRRSGRGWMYVSIVLICVIVAGTAGGIILLSQREPAPAIEAAEATPVVAAAATVKPAAATAEPAPTPPPAATLEPPAPAVGANSVIAGIVENNPIPEIYKRTGASVVGIVNKVKYFSNLERGMTEDIATSGSGIIISEDGYIITNSHVVEGGSSFIAIMADGEEVPAELVGSDGHTDLAVLKVDKRGLTAAALGDSSAMEIGEIVIAVGSPLGQEFGGTVTMGIISGKNRVIDLDNVRYTLLQTDAAINPGSSGGPLMNLKGEVIGINTLKFGVDVALEGLGFAIPINDARPVIEELMRHGRVTRPALGFSGMTIDETMADMYDLPQGVFVMEVLEGSPAEQAGMLEEDIIIAVDGVDVYMFADLLEVLERHEIGDTVEVRVYRDSALDELTMQITLYELPED